MTRLVAISLLAGLVAPEAWSQPPPLHVVAPKIDFPARLLAFDLTIGSGRVTSVADCPAGWKVTADNDPSWNAHVVGQAYVGAAAVEVREIGRIIRIVQMPRADVFAGLDPQVRVSGTLTLMVGGRLKVSPFSKLALITTR